MAEVSLHAWMENNPSDPLDGDRRTILVVHDGPRERRVVVKTEGHSWDERRVDFKRHMEAVMAAVFRVAREEKNAALSLP